MQPRSPSPADKQKGLCNLVWHAIGGGDAVPEPEHRGGTNCSVLSTFTAYLNDPLLGVLNQCRLQGPRDHGFPWRTHTKHASRDPKMLCSA